ncbi:MAG: hypothetical protein J4G12_08005 [Gemmatimonadetes bacterium]|nr:hypothetical protein [Gemmatimonadota bacterium]
MALRTSTYAPDELVPLVLGLARNLQAEDMAAQLAAVRRPVDEHRDPELSRFMAEKVNNTLGLRKYPEEMKTEGAKIMAEVVDVFQRSLDDLVERGRQQGMQQGAREERVSVLHRQVARRFGNDAAG